MIGIDAGFLRHQFGVVAMMRDEVVLARDADHRIGAAAQLARHDQAEDARQIGAERHDLEIEHQLGVLFKAVGDTDGAIGQLEILRGLRFRVLNTLLDVAHGVEILAKLGPVAVAEAARQAAGFFHDRIEDAAFFFGACEPLGAGAAVAEQALEDYAGLILGDVGRGRIAPGNGIDVETVARIAGTGRGRIDGHFDRLDLRVLADDLGRELIGSGRELHFDAGTRSVISVNTGQPGRRRAGVVAAAIALGIRLQVRQAGENIELAVQLFKRLQVGRQFEAVAELGGLPLGEMTPCET